MPGGGKPLPFFAKVGISLMMTREDGTMHPVFFTVDKLGEGGLFDLLDTMLEQFAGQGFFPVSQEQYANFAIQLLKTQQSEFVIGPLQDRTTDPEELRKFLAGYEGRKGGDA